MYTSLDRHRRVQDVEAIRTIDNQYLKMVSLSTLHTNCLYLREIHATHFFSVKDIVQSEGLVYEKSEKHIGK